MRYWVTVRAVLGTLTAAAVIAVGLSAAPDTAQAAAKPKITKVSPKTGSTTGGTLVTITGSGFTKVKKVTVGGKKVKKLTVLSSKKLRFRTPAHAAGKATITITTAAGKVSKTKAFTYKAPAPKPSPTPLPTSGPIVATSGQTITGRHITNAAGPCVTVPAGVSDVTIRGNEIGPCGGGVDGLGVLIKQGATRVNVVGNTIHDVSSGAHAVGSIHPIIFANNTVYNVRGPFPRGQMIQFDSVTGGSGQSKIIGNVSDKQRATITTGYEDHINMYKSSGSQAAPILIACNKIRGGGSTDNSVTGSGIMVGDNGGSWFDIRNNVIVLTPNTGIGIAGAQHVAVSGNLIDNRGSDRGSKTQEALTAFPYAGFTPAELTITNNKASARAWVYGDGALLDESYWFADGISATLSGNDWRYTTKTTAQVWATTPTCP